MSSRNERTVKTAIIGAGFGGLCVALKLARDGQQDFVVLDEADGVGGTWHANTYPGAACDAPSHVYSYSFARGDWSRRFAPGPEIAQYLSRCVDEGGIADRVELGVKVESAVWEGSRWRLTLAGGGAVLATVLVVATGQLRVPKVPQLPGLETFAGPAFHTARWQHDISLEGQRVAVIGTGASAVQVLPEIVDGAAQVTVFQRSAHYVLPKPDSVYGKRLRRLYERFPLLPRAARGAISASFEALGLGFWRWPALLSPLASYHRRALAGAVRDPQVRDALTPRDQPGCKRLLISSDFHQCFDRPDVELTTAPIVRVSPHGVVTSTPDGEREHDADVMIFATGFETDTFAQGLDIIGRSGGTLQQTWDADVVGAHLGISVADFPNLFLIYGPNTNLGSGSIIYMLEAQADHVVSALAVLDREPGTALEVRPEAQQAFSDMIRTRQRRGVWATGCTSWYLDEHGNNTHNWPTSPYRYRRQAARIDLADYELIRTGSR